MQILDYVLFKFESKPLLTCIEENKTKGLIFYTKCILPLAKPIMDPGTYALQSKAFGAFNRLVDVGIASVLTIQSREVCPFVFPKPRSSHVYGLPPLCS